MAVIATESIYAQNWQFVTGRMNGTAVNPEGAMLAVGERGIIFRSTDNGSSWSLPQSGTYQNLYNVAFISLTRVIAVGAYGTILISDDAGESWSHIDAETEQLIIRLVFPTSQKGYMLGADSLFESNDAGDSWSAVAEVPEKPESLWFINESLGLLAAYGGHLYRTVDGGRNWTEVYTDITQTFRSVAFTKDGTVGFVCGPLGTILKTADSGKTWDAVSGPNPGFYPLSMVVRDNGLVVLTGTSLSTDQIVLQRSENSGNTWETVPVESKFSGLAFSNICLNSSGQGIIVSNLGSILYTSDAWKSYTIITEPTHEFPNYGFTTFRRPAFATDQIGVVPNSLFPGGYSRTTDGGITWLSLQYGAGKYSAPTFFSESTGLILRERPTLLYRTLNAGETWEPAIAEADPSNGNVSDMRFFDADHGLQTGYILKPNRLGGNQSAIVYATEDGANNWKGTTFDWPPDISGMAVAGEQTAWIAGGSAAINADSANQFYSYGRIYRTTDAGETWDTIYDKYGKGVFPVIAGFRNETHGFIAVGGDDWGYPGQAVLLETTDAGDSWQVLRPFDQTKGESAPIDIAFFTDSIWYGVGGNASIWVTTDAGKTWEQEVIDPLPTLYNGRVPTFYKITLLPDEQTAMIFGQGVMLRRTFPQPFSSVNEEKGSKRMEGQLSAVPNPAQQEVHLFWNGSGQRLQIRLYDMMGRDVLGKAVPVDPSGSVEIQASELPSGLYQAVLYDRLGRKTAAVAVTLLQ